MYAYKGPGHSVQETMNHDKWKQPKVPERMNSSRSPKLKLQSVKKLQGNSTPISKLCESLTSSTLRTPGKTSQETVEPMVVGTPQISQKFTAETPSSVHDDNPVQTPVLSRKYPPFDNIKDTPTHSPDTPKRKVISPIGSPLCVALGKPLKTKSISFTPKRSSRRSCVIKSHVSEKEEIHSKNVCESESLVDSATLLQIIEKLPDIAVVDTEDTTNNSLLYEERNIENKHPGKNLFVESQKGESVPSSLDWLPGSTQYNVVHHNGITTEPRHSKKSDLGIYSARRLSFSAKKISSQKKGISDYDPDNDIFAQGLMPVQFDIDSLKSHIGTLLNNGDVPSPKLRKSHSCGVLNNQSVTSVSTRRKQTKRSPSSASKATLKRTVSAPDLLENVAPVTSIPKETATMTMATSSCSKVSEGKIRALLRARDIIKNIRERAKKYVSQAEKESSGTEFLQSNSKEKTRGNSPTQSHLNINSPEPSTRNSDLMREPATDEFDSALLPPTQPFESFILGDVTAYVEVISKNENISAGVKKELMKLGATVVPAFNRDVPVTHVIFNDGHISTYKKAKKRNIPLVSVLWIEACRKAGVKVHESLFPPNQIERYESPAAVKELRKRRIMKFYSDEKQRPSPRQKKGVTNNESPTQPSIETADPNNSVRRSSAPKWVEEVAGGNGMVRMLVKMTGISQKEFKELVNRPPTPDSDIEMDQNSPLPVRLLRKLAQNLPAGNNSHCNDTSKNDEHIETTSNIKTTVNNSFAKKLCEVREMEEQMENRDERNAEITESCSLSNANDTSQIECSNKQNISQRKKVTKRKLLSPVQESLTVQNANDDVAGTVVENPHSCTPRRLSGEKIGKKRKSDNTEIELVDTGKTKNKAEKETMIKDNNCEVNSLDPIRRSRRSSSYFIKSKRNSPSPVLQKPALVCTQLHSTDVDLVVSVVEQLGMFVVEKNVTSHTTHIVTGAPKRTMKLLKGMARGCWIVAHEWVLRSLEVGKWLDEEEFEVTTFSPAVQKYRLEKLSFGGIFKPDIFSSCGPIFVSSHATAPREDLVELILLCGGETASRASRAKIAVGKRYSDIISVTALWVLDSIQYYCCKPFDSYHCS